MSASRILSLVVVCACAGRDSKAERPVVAPRIVARTPPPTSRTCTPAHFVTYGSGEAVAIVAIGPDCRTRVVSTMEIEGGVFDVAWPRRDQPLALAAAEEGALGATHVVVIEQPLLADAAKRPPPRTIAPPGKGDIEPEGFEWRLVTDGTGVFVERCASWGDDGGGGEEAEEWDCAKHIYFALDDKAGHRAKRLRRDPRDPFAPVFAGGTVPGTGVTLRRSRRGTLTCTVGGKSIELDQSIDPKLSLSLIPVSATDYFLGVDRNGSRMRAWKHVDYQRYRGCDPRDAGDEIVAGPAGYWAEKERGKGWIIHAAGGAAVLDAAGQPAVFPTGAVAWTQP